MKPPRTRKRQTTIEDTVGDYGESAARIEALVDLNLGGKKLTDLLTDLRPRELEVLKMRFDQPLTANRKMLIGHIERIEARARMKLTPKIPVVTYAELVGAALRARREAIDSTQPHLAMQPAFAKAVGVTQSTWSRIEQGRSALSVTQLARIARFLDITPSMILIDADVGAMNARRDGIGVDVDGVPISRKAIRGLLVLRDLA